MRPRLLVVTPDFLPGPGGIQLLMGRLAEHLEGFETVVVTRQVRGDVAYDRAAPFAVVRVGRSGAPNRVTLPLVNLVGARRARRLRPDAILLGHVFTGLPAVLGAPSVLLLHADEVPAHPRVTRRVLERVTRSVAVSRHTASLAESFGAHPDHVRVIAPGVDLPARTEAGGARAPILVTVARLSDAYKGHDVVLRALVEVRRRVPDVRWVVIGDGPLRAGLQELATRLGVQDIVEFAGRVSDGERDVQLRCARVFVMPSRLPANGGGEGFGIVYLEAGAHGLPVVAGAVAGALDAVEHGVTGLLVDPTDERAVAGALTSLLLDDALCARLGAAGRARAERQSWPAVAARVAEVLHEAMAVG